MPFQNTIVQIRATLILICAFVSVSGENISGDIIEVVNNICDYEDLCLSDELGVKTRTRQTTNAEHIIRQPDKKCCQPCLCANKCVHENCCPGAIRHPTLHATCRAQNKVFNVHRGLREIDAATIGISDYFIVDTCPDNASENLQRSCLEPEALEDHVFVSSFDNSVIFKNAKCAECNEVYSYRTWKQLLYNKDATYPNLNMMFNSSSVNYIVNTYVFSVPLKEDFKVMAAHKCVTKAERQSVCPRQTIDTDLTDECATMEGPLFTTYGITFPNTFCFACQYLDIFVKGSDNVCRFSEDNRFQRKSYPLIVILNYKDPVTVAPVHNERACESGDIQNPITVSTSEINRFIHVCSHYSTCFYGKGNGLYILFQANLTVIRTCIYFQSIYASFVNIKTSLYIIKI